VYREYPPSAAESTLGRLAFRGQQVKEIIRAYRLEYLEKSAVAEDSVDFGHNIQFHNTFILDTKTGYTEGAVREATETKLHPNNMSREAVICLSKSWKPPVSSLRKLSGNYTISTRQANYTD
jgi:hypothetical protein